MNVTTTSNLDITKYNGIIIPCFEGQQPSLETLPQQTATYLKANKFEGKYESKAMFAIPVQETLVQYLFVGLGKKEELTVEKAMSVIGSAVKTLSKKELASVAVSFTEIEESILTEHFVLSVVKACSLACYAFDKFMEKEKEKQKIETLTYILSQTHIQAVKKGVSIAEDITLARLLVDEPANLMKPKNVVEVATRVCQKAGIEMKVFEKEEIEKMNMNAFLSVAKGSDEEPRLIVMKYNGNPESDEIVALVGKGLTYDSGGYSIKPTNSMITMKSDMGGSAAVIGAMSAIAKEAPKINVVGIIATCENMISGRAYLPGDVLTSMSGKTIEIVNTDAEGRLTLADAITYAIQKEHATKIVDICTLTGAVVVALGEDYAGVITREDSLWEDIQTSAKTATESIWRMPIDKNFEKKNKSTIADIKNSGGRWGGCSSAGAFVGAFTEGKPWIHIDIAGSAYLESEKPYFTAGATGSGVHLLTELVKHWAK